MNPKHSAKTLLFFLVIVASSATAGGAEIILPVRIECRSNLVRLLDIVEIRDEDAREKLAKIELFSAPLPGQERVVRRRELQEMMTLYGFNPTHFQFSGAERVVVTGAKETLYSQAQHSQAPYSQAPYSRTPYSQTPYSQTPSVDDQQDTTKVNSGLPSLKVDSAQAVAPTIYDRSNGRPSDSSYAEQTRFGDSSVQTAAGPESSVGLSREHSLAQDRIERGIVTYLKRNVDPLVDWQVSAGISQRYVRDLAGRLTEFHVSGGRPPYRGKQQFLIEARVNNRDLQIAVQADVNSPDMIVVAAGNLARGEKVRATGLTLAAPPHGVTNRKYFHSIDEVAGMETLRAIAQGQPLEPSSVRHPMLVRRSEHVTVYSRSGGVSVHTTGRALDDGALGEIVTVETGYRKKLQARVIGFQELEVYAKGPTVRTAATTPR
ncbi:MAG: flagella basal body P-ring formation protein FlgA [Pirellulaceae bacterium]|jgi:flagella basal body P-ring formation protein FlgA